MWQVLEDMFEDNNKRESYAGKACPTCGRVGEVLNTLKDLHALIDDLRRKNYDLHEKYAQLLKENEAIANNGKMPWQDFFSGIQRGMIIPPPAINAVEVNIPHTPHFPYNTNGDVTVWQLKAIIGNQEEKIRALSEKLSSLSVSISMK